MNSFRVEQNGLTCRIECVRHNFLCESGTILQLLGHFRGFKSTSFELDWHDNKNTFRSYKEKNAITSTSLNAECWQCAVCIYQNSVSGHLI